MQSLRNLQSKRDHQTIVSNKSSTSSNGGVLFFWGWVKISLCYCVAEAVWLCRFSGKALFLPQHALYYILVPGSK
jgi:hypothetical protein